MLPYLICGTCELIYWYYTAITTITQEDNEWFIIIFYNFFYNTIVPLKGVLNGVAFLLGSPAIRSLLHYVFCCCCYSIYHKIPSQNYQNVGTNTNNESLLGSSTNTERSDIYYRGDLEINNEEVTFGRLDTPPISSLPRRRAPTATPNYVHLSSDEILTATIPDSQ